jgi:hypothetical protein
MKQSGRLTLTLQREDKPLPFGILSYYRRGKLISLALFCSSPKWLDWEFPPVVKNQGLKYPSAFEIVKRGGGGQARIRNPKSKIVPERSFRSGTNYSLRYYICNPVSVVFSNQ